MEGLSYIYLLISNGEPKAVFTVKHACAAYLSRHYPVVLEGVNVYRVRDGYVGPFVDITHEFYE